MKLETALYKALVAANVSEENAIAVIDALEKKMSSNPGPEANTSGGQTELQAEIALLRTEMRALFYRLELRIAQLAIVMGTVIIVALLIGFKSLH
ncbi:hypothetical protein [Pseudomonas batumici]|uniref:Transmembrane protein n=1 Tax=Pseudomonas batumici TaxID=226910 RepID=A0A0C2HTS7_9PSED|nr:hypothetical protein [Pseudomonas batumici]KIH80566.1 hypothetical protein UCMB321_5695 [Pseudomonas batumici]